MGVRRNEVRGEGNSGEMRRARRWRDEGRGEERREMKGGGVKRVWEMREGYMRKDM